MPKLLFFLPCERVIVSQEGPISLITVLEKYIITLSDEEAANLPGEAVLPVTWNVISMWLREEGDENRQFEQRVQLILPDGRIPTDAVSRFTIAASNVRQRNIVQVAGFPISTMGQCKVKILLREAGEENAWVEIAECPIELERARPDTE